MLPFELAEFLPDRVKLAAQEELALRFFHTLADVLADALAHSNLGKYVTQPSGHLGQTLGNVDCLKQLDLAFVGKVGAEAGRVGQRAGTVDLAQHRDHARVVARLEDLLDDSAILAREFLHVLINVLWIGAFDDTDAQCAACRLGGAKLAAVQGPQGDAAVAAG